MQQAMKTSLSCAVLGEEPEQAGRHASVRMESVRRACAILVDRILREARG